MKLNDLHQRVDSQGLFGEKSSGTNISSLGILGVSQAVWVKDGVTSQKNLQEA